MFVNIRRMLLVVPIVRLHVLPSDSREVGGLLGRFATFPDCSEDSSSTGFEKTEESCERP